MSSLRATAAPLLESDVRGAALLASFRNDFRRLLAEFRRFSSPDGSEIQENTIHQENPTRSVAKSEPRVPKSGPEAPKEGPRARQEGPVGGQDSATGAPGGLPRRPRDSSETISALRKPKKSSVKSPLWRESLEKRIRFDFSLIFEARAQTRQCKKRVKTYGFPMFFVSRLFFERIGPLERKANEKQAKSTPRAPKIDLRSTEIALRNPFRATSVDQVDRKCF